jgi:F-type H+-transporting ATPase subunit delta
MKAEANKVARQYAEAVLDIAYKANPGAADVIYKDIKLVNSAFTAEPDLGLVIGHPSVPAEEKRKILVSLFQSRVQELTLRLVELLLDKRRIYIMPALETEFHALLNARKNIVSASLTSADKLGDNAVADIKARLTEHLGSSLELDVKVDPTLLGGVVLKLGDQVIDGSLKGKLASIEKMLMSV